MPTDENDPEVLKMTRLAPAVKEKLRAYAMSLAKQVMPSWEEEDLPTITASLLVGAAALDSGRTVRYLAQFVVDEVKPNPEPTPEMRAELDGLQFGMN